MKKKKGEIWDESQGLNWSNWIDDGYSNRDKTYKEISVLAELKIEIKELRMLLTRLRYPSSIQIELINKYQLLIRN